MTQPLRSAGNGRMQRIQTSGAYVGTITKAKHVVSGSKGAHGIEFSFEAEQEKADYMTLWVMKQDGSVIEYFQGIADSIATCMKQREYSAQQATITEYDYTTRQKAQVQAWVYPALMNKPVGLILQAEERQKNNGDVVTRMNIVGAFDAQTRQTAVEILDKAEPELLNKIVASLKDKKLKPQNGYGGYSNTDDAQPQTAQQGFEDYDGDIPF